jgi:hypothetical protein
MGSGQSNKAGNSVAGFASFVRLEKVALLQIRAFQKSQNYYKYFG